MASATVVRRQAPGKHEGQGGVKRLEQRPVEGLAQPARPVGALGRLGVEQDAVGDLGEARRHAATSSADADGQRLDDGDAGLVADGLDAMRRFGAVQLDPVGPERRDLGDAACCRD